MDYFSHWTLRYETDSLFDNITAGVRQGSVLGPLLWNVMFDGIFKIQFPEKLNIVGFADDVAILVQLDI